MDASPRASDGPPDAVRDAAAAQGAAAGGHGADVAPAAEGVAARVDSEQAAGPTVPETRDDAAADSSAAPTPAVRKLVRPCGAVRCRARLRTSLLCTQGFLWRELPHALYRVNLIYSVVTRQLYLVSAYYACCGLGRPSVSDMHARKCPSASVLRLLRELLGLGPVWASAGVIGLDLRPWHMFSARTTPPRFHICAGSPGCWEARPAALRPGAPAPAAAPCSLGRNPHHATSCANTGPRHARCTTPPRRPAMGTWGLQRRALARRASWQSTGVLQMCRPRTWPCYKIPSSDAGTGQDSEFRVEGLGRVCRVGHCHVVRELQQGSNPNPKP
eukprot:365187-Chlamydomonas_euryale.AAC.13